MSGKWWRVATGVERVDRWPEKVSIRVSPDQHEALLRLADEQQRTASSVAREAIAAYLQRASRRVPAEVG